MSVLTGSALGLFGVIIGEKLLIDLSFENISPLEELCQSLVCSVVHTIAVLNACIVQYLHGQMMLIVLMLASLNVSSLICCYNHS